MKNLFLVILFFQLSVAGICQSDRTYESLEEALRKPELVEKLDLRESPVTQVDPKFKKFIHLKELCLRDCKISELPDFLQALPSTCLDLSNTKLTEIPLSIRNYKQLETLLLFDDKISHIPYWLGELKTLYCFGLSGNKNVDSLNNLGRLIWMDALDLSELGLKQIPDFVFEMKKLDYLKMTDNEIASIPQQLNNLKNLKFLNLSSNKIQEFPNNLEFPKMETLYLADNPLKSIPVFVSKMQHLQEFSISETDIVSLPADLLKIKTLELVMVQKSKIPEALLDSYKKQNPKIYWLQ